ncbi:hypothetical protein ABTD84_19415, partial [Acinetobacter baumannii]
AQAELRRRYANQAKFRRHHVNDALRAIRVTVEDAARRALFPLEPWTLKRIRAVELSMNAGFQIIEEPVVAGPGADGSLGIAGESFLAGGMSI